MQDPRRVLNAGGVDAISGVSITANSFFELAQEALRGARR
jgi:major membrane immunogen (membrane-anchored lipoprotein)